MKKQNKQIMIEYECKKCGYSWIPRKPNPIVCPKCKSYNWDQEEKEK